MADDPRAAFRGAAEAAGSPLAASAADPWDRQRGRTVAGPARRADRWYSFIALFARGDGAVHAFAVRQRGIQRIGAVQIGAIRLTAETVPESTTG